jgi:hypothetical protein
MPKLSPVSFLALRRVFETEGFRPVFVIKNNSRKAGISRERFFELLGQS